MLSVIKHAVDAIFLSATQCISKQHMVHAAQFSCCSAKLHFFYSCGPSSPEMNSNEYSTRFMESILKKSSSSWLNSGKPLTQHLKDAIFTLPCFSM